MDFTSTLNNPVGLFCHIVTKNENEHANCLISDYLGYYEYVKLYRGKYERYMGQVISFLSTEAEIRKKRRETYYFKLQN